MSAMEYWIEYREPGSVRQFPLPARNASVSGKLPDRWFARCPRCHAEYADMRAVCNCRPAPPAPAESEDTP